MSRVFITGIAGFLGSHLAERLDQLGHTVIGVDNMLGGDAENVPPGVKWYEYVDVQHTPWLSDMMAGCDVVYHCAAAPHEGLSVFSPTIVTEHTYGSTVAVVRAVIAAKVKRLVFTSSMARYGEQPTLPFLETMIPQPQDPYGVAKYASELLIACMARAHGFEYVIAVPHNIIGPRQRYTDPFRNVAAIMINLMLQRRQPYIYGDGEQRRAFTYIDDAVDPLVKMGFQEDLDGEVINIGPDEEFVSVNQLAEMIARLTGFSPLRPVYIPEGRPMEVKAAYCSSERSRRWLDYHTTYSLEDGLLNMMRWIRRKGPRPFEYHLPIEIPTENLPRTWKEKLF